MPSNDLIQRLPRHLKMSELRVFVAVLEHRSFRKAAGVVHLSQPAVTKAIAGLEQTLGVKLFDRHANGVEPTVHGLSFAPRAVAVFDELRRAAQDLAMVSSGATGTLRIGTVPMPAIPFLPIAVQRLVHVHPRAFVSVVEARESELLDRLRRRDIDLAVLRLSLVDPAEDMLAETLFDEALCVVACRDHPLAARKHLAWPELLQQRWVLPPADCFFFEHLLRTLDKSGLALPRHAVESFEVSVQYGMVLHGGMLSFGMRSRFEFAPGKNLLVRLPFELTQTRTAVSSVTLRSHDPTPLAQQLIAHIRAQLTPA
jgi:DNA-binding transcriptional LysR family regulator